jgi:hypothetical protein
MASLRLEAHGLAVVVYGDTKPIKDILQSHGGHWIRTFGGWFFPGSYKDTLKKALGRHSDVKTIKDMAGKLGGASPTATVAKKRATLAPVDGKKKVMKAMKATKATKAVNAMKVIRVMKRRGKP